MTTTDWTFQGFAGKFDEHVHEQLPWYSLATQAVALAARHHIPRHGLVYDIGCSTGNIGRILAPTLEARECALVALDNVQDMIDRYAGSGTPILADAAEFDYEPFDVAICMLTLMFLPVSRRRSLLSMLRNQMKPGGAIIIVDKCVPPAGYNATVFTRLTWEGKLARGADPGAVVKKETQLVGIQRPLYPGELGHDALEIFRYGDFAGWIIDAR